jgi:DNA-binding beta-propeller fold protein YncE
MLSRTRMIVLTAVVLVCSFPFQGADASAADAPTFSISWGSAGTDPGEFNGPAGLALDTAGNVYVADSLNDRVQVFDQNGAFLRQWGGPGTGDGEFDELYGIAVDGSDVYVTDYQNTRVEKFDTSGTFITSWGTTGNDPSQFYKPEAITTDADGNVYVSDTGNFRVEKFDADGNYLMTFGSRGTGPGQLRHPEGLAVDTDRNLYVTDPGNYRVQEFDAAGNFIRMWGTQGTGPGQFGRPDEGLVLDSLGNVYVTDTSNDRVQKFDPEGNFLASWGATGTGDGAFDFPYGIAITSAGDVYVSDLNGERVQRFAQVRRPDALIRRAGTGVSFVGDDVYNETAVGQTRSRRVSPGRRSQFVVELQNDGSFLDGVGLQGCASTSSFTVGYRSGSTTVTAAMVAGTYHTNVVPPGTAGTIKVAVTAAPEAPTGATLRCEILASSLADPSKRDVVVAKLIVT